MTKCPSLALVPRTPMSEFYSGLQSQANCCQEYVRPEETAKTQSKPVVHVATQTLAALLQLHQQKN